MSVADMDQSESYENMYPSDQNIDRLKSEITMLKEQLGQQLTELLGTPGGDKNEWVIPGTITYADAGHVWELGGWYYKAETMDEAVRQHHDLAREDSLRAAAIHFHQFRDFGHAVRNTSDTLLSEIVTNSFEDQEDVCVCLHDGCLHVPGAANFEEAMRHLERLLS